MRVVVTGATGNVGTSLVRALLADPRVSELVGVTRRGPGDWQPARVRWHEADVGSDDLAPAFDGVDAVVHLAWLIQPSRDKRTTHLANVVGSRRVFDAVAAAGVRTLIHASSVAAYSPAHPGQVVDETWPTGGVASSYYGRQKAEVESILDAFELRHPEVRVARARPGLIFKREAASELRRYFGGPLVPGSLARPRLIQLVPQMRGLEGQVLHADDAAELYRLLCVTETARGAYNVAAPPLDGAAIARLLHARPVTLSPRITRALIGATWLARLHPVSPDWLDLALQVPVMNTARAVEELGWAAQHDAGAVLLELLGGLRDGAGFMTPPLDPKAGGPLRLREFVTGVGRRDH